MAKNKINIISEENIFTIEWTKVKRVKIDKKYSYIHLYTVHTHTSTSTYICIHKYTCTYVDKTYTYIYKRVSKTVQIYKLRLSLCYLYTMWNNIYKIKIFS